MGTFPTAYDYGRPIPQPSGGIAVGQPAQESGAAAQTMYEAGTEWKQAAKETDDYALHLDTLAAQDALNKLRVRRDDLTFGPQDGFLNIKGGDVLKPAADGTPLPTSYQTRFQTASDSIAAGLNSPRARQMFSQKAIDEGEGFKKQFAMHALQQTEVFRKNVFTDATTQIAKDAVRYAGDPKMLDELAKRAEVAAGNYATAEGLQPAAMMAAARSNVYRTAVEVLIPTNPSAAGALFDANRGSFDGSDAVALTGKIKDATEHRRAQDIVGLVTSTGGVSPNYDSKAAGAESGGNAFIENKIGALGKYQFTPPTYTGLGQQTEWGKGKSQAEIRAMLLDPKDGPARQDELQKAFTSGSTRALQGNNVPVNDLTLYMTAFLGHGAGPALLKLPDSTPLKAGLVQAHTGSVKDPAAYTADVYDKNPFLAKVETVGDLKALMAQKIGAPLSLAQAGSPEKPNLDAMLSAGLTMAGNDPDLRDRVSAAIKTDYATKHAIYTAQVTGLQKQAMDHILGGGTIENMPTQIRGALDSDSMIKVQAFETNILEKRRKLNSDGAIKDLSDLNRLGQLTDDDVVKRRNVLTGPEYESWRKTAAGGAERANDDSTYERLQRGLGSRDMRDDIFAAHRAGDINSPTRDALLDKDAAFRKEGAPATPYKIGHDYVMRSLDPGLMGSGISREIAGRAIKEYDQYVAGNPAREGEAPDAYAKRLDTFATDTVKRHSLIKTSEMAVALPVPANTAFNRSDMTTLPKPDATRKVTGGMQDLTRRFDSGQITQDQYDADTLVLMQWKKFIDDRADTAPLVKK